MQPIPSSGELTGKYYLSLAAAFVRGKLSSVPDGTNEAIVRHGLEQGLRLHKFKRSSIFPMSRRIMDPFSRIVVGYHGGRTGLSGCRLLTRKSLFPPLDPRDPRIRAG
jgi:hypothetical protein